MARSLEAERAEFETPLIPDTEEDWLELRKPWWGASIVSTLFGEHEHLSLGDVCVEKLRGKVPETEEKRLLYQRGHRWEPYIRDQVTDVLGLRLSDPWTMYRRGPIMATPDAEVLDRDDVCIELKTAREFLGLVVKRQWWWQAQALNWCLDTERCVVAALDSSLEVVYFEIERDDDAINRAVTMAQDMLDVLEWGDIPDWVDLSAENVTRLWPRDSGQARELPTEVAGWVAKYDEAHRNMKGWEKQKLHYRDLVVSSMGADAIASVGGEQVATYRTSKDRRVIDWRRMIEENPDLAAKYTNTVPGTRTFRPSIKGVRALGGLDGDDEDF